MLCKNLYSIVCRRESTGSTGITGIMTSSNGNPILEATVVAVSHNVSAPADAAGPGVVSRASIGARVSIGVDGQQAVHLQLPFSSADDASQSDL